MINGNKIGYEDSGLSKREWNELMEILDQKSIII
jgi:thymidylate synthase (FAD)